MPIDHRPFSRNPLSLTKDFWHCFRLLWKDPLGQVSLAVTTLFWGAGATLRLLVLSWAAIALNYNIGEAAWLTAWVAIGIAIGSVLAAKFVKLEHSVKVLPVGIAMGLLVLVMIPITNSVLATFLLVAIGAMGGYFVVPMNALLQHRGHLLMGAGRSIAVQNFNENLSIFAMLGLYAVMQKLDLSIYLIIRYSACCCPASWPQLPKSTGTTGQGTKIRQIQSLRISRASLQTPQPAPAC